MKLFIMQYKKLLICCAIPVVVASAFLGYRLVHAQSNVKALPVVNEQMQQLLDGVDPSKLSPSSSPQVGTENPTPVLEATVQESTTQESTEPGKASKSISKTTNNLKKPKSTPKQTPKKTPKPTHPKANKPTSSPSIIPQVKKSTEIISAKININKSSADELMKLPEIGASKAKAIVNYREQINGFKTLEDIIQVKGIGPKIFAEIKDLIEL
ncbi:MAG: competence protein ComEA helix-hairpin-helix repeat protein [Bacilli bacterium]|nr:competence protein ComEA helix-hairpin-helix repeat protein [Bacilli bacterium]